MERWQKILLYGGGLAGSAALAYYLLRPDADVLCTVTEATTGDYLCELHVSRNICTEALKKLVQSTTAVFEQISLIFDGIVLEDMARPFADCPNVITIQCSTNRALHAKAQRKYPEAFHMASTYTGLMRAAESGNAAECQNCLAVVTEPELRQQLLLVPGSLGNTALHFAAQSGDEEVCRQLLAAASVKAHRIELLSVRNSAGRTPGMWAFQAGHKSLGAKLAHAAAEDGYLPADLKESRLELASGKIKTVDKVTFKHVFSVDNPGNIDDYYRFDRKRGNSLGKGSFGMVWKGKCKDTGAERAVKMIQKKKIKDQNMFATENGIHQSLDHPHVVKLHEVFEDREFYYLVMEICDGGELFDRITEAASQHEGSAFDEIHAAAYMGQIFGAMTYLHTNSVAHRDIKPENFVMNCNSNDAVIKLIDFGLAKRYTKGERMTTKAGTPYYVAPEVLAANYDYKCDVWSCGVLMYLLICGYPPFSGESDIDIIRAVMSMQFDFIEEDWCDISGEGKAMIQLMLSGEKDRPEFITLLEHPWMIDHAPKRGGSVTKDIGARLTQFRNASIFKKMAITCIATQLEDSQIEELKITFELLDKNHEGRLSQDEIINGMRDNGITVPVDMAETLKCLDTDGSGQIDFTEFIAATLEESQFMKEELMWTAFRKFDLDSDGVITKAELKKVSEITDDGLIVALIKDADIDGDGTINFEEFKTMMKKIISAKYLATHSPLPI